MPWRRIVITGLFILNVSFAQNLQEVQARIPGQLIVRHQGDPNDPAVASLFAASHAQVHRTLPKLKVSVIQVPKGSEAAVVQALSASTLVAGVEYDHFARVGASPNDPNYSSQWHLAKIQASTAWNVSTGSGTPIAILDSGVDSTHPDLGSRVWPGWNFVSNNNNTADVLGHGTAVAGAVAAVTNNGIGVAGVSWANPILPVVVVDSTGYAAYSNIAAGIQYAADQGARVISVSLGGSSPSSALQSAVNYAWNKGAVVVAAAMNNGNSTPEYPAACTNVIAVSATDENDNLASFSDYGNWITLSAPGTDIMTTQMGGSYGMWEGTSLATPIVAGVAALALAVNPGLSAQAVVTLLEQNSDQVGGSGYSTSFGWGRVNAYRAVTAAMGGGVSQPVSVTITPGSSSLTASQGAQFYATVANTSNTAVTWSLSPAVGTLYSGGYYAAPSSITNTQAVTVTATSVADPTKSASAVVTLNPASGGNGTATFIKTDVTTMGNWKGVYGSDGYAVMGDSTAYPAYAAVNPAGQAFWMWAASTSDPRALQQASAGGRVAGTWYSSSSFTIDVNLTDGQTHQVALYCLDWDYMSRVESISVLNTAGAVLDTRTVSGFSNGAYLVWNVSGHVTFKVSLAGGVNAVVSGLLFGGSASAGSVSFVKLDNTTMGNWKGVYGTNGYSVVGDSTSYPAFATVTPGGQQSWTWAADTTDIRALQKASASDRIAATWFSGTSFTIDVNLTDGQTHSIALYCLDWDYNGRAETITVQNASGSVLDTRTVSGFSNGQYLVWNVSGHVTFKLTTHAGPNAVVSGIFF